MFKIIGVEILRDVFCVNKNYLFFNVIVDVEYVEEWRGLIIF